MMRGGLIAMLLVAAMTLAACDNYVMAEKPWFRAEDAVGAQAVRPGWWIAKQPGCAVDPNAASAAWPDCANALLVPADWKGVLWSDDGADHLLAPGTPLIAQYHLVTSVEAAVPAQSTYLYFGIGVLQQDMQARALALRYWPVLCGPPPSKHPSRVTHHPWGRVRPLREGGCVAPDVRALREAAALSRGLETEAPTLRWLRDWRPGDQAQADWLAAQGIRTH